MTSKEIAEKYVYGTHDALTQKQEVIDMIEDIENYAKSVGESDIIDLDSDNEDDCNIIPDECPKCESNVVGVVFGENECFDCQHVWL